MTTARSHSYFITGTDTGIGKTLISCALLYKLRELGHKPIGMKPIAAGAEHTPAGLRNEDAVSMIAAADSHNNHDTQAPYELINPYCYEPGIAPHIAADLSNTPVDMQRIVSAYQQLQQQSDSIIVEGAGGWLVPINDDNSFADLAAKLALPVVLVVGIRLGCLNHALLTQQAIASTGLHLAGWVANIIDPDMPLQQENIAYLEKHLPCPRLGTIPYLSNADFTLASQHIELPPRS